MAASAVETTKITSNHLRGALAAELEQPTEPFSAESGNLLKFHGIYQQDDRDVRRERTRRRQPLAHSCMVRCSVPGGILARDQWLAIDAVADEVADGRLRLTTRQGVQYHFVHKGDLRELVRSLDRGLVTTYAACGDVVRNVMATSAPFAGRDLERLEAIAHTIAARFRPQSSAYWELWLDGERAASLSPPAIADNEPIYGDSYLPRKFKIGIAWPGDNSVDVFSQDVGIIPADGPDGEPGVVILAGGGLGRSHTDDTTFPRLADPLAWVPDHEVGDAIEAIVTTFRDKGNREDRSHARLKYLVADRGIGWLRREIEARVGHGLADPVELPAWGRPRDQLGWHRQDDGRWFLGLPVPTGRLEDTEHVQRRLAVRRIVARHADEVRLTPHQDILLCNIDADDKVAVDALLTEHGVLHAEHLPPSVLSSMACPALPTCGQALGEAERVLPDVAVLLDRLLTDVDLADVRIETRMTGCPNGCARPYVAELGIVGRSKTAYDLFVGGDPAGTRLAEVLIESVPFAKLGDVLRPLVEQFARDRQPDETFGGWARRVGVDELRKVLPDVGRRRRTVELGQP